MELKSKSIKHIFPILVRNLGLGDRELPVYDIIEWCAYALGQIECYGQYVEKYNEDIIIDNHRATLPCDFVRSLDNPGLVYKITGDMITSPLEKGTIKFNYLAFELDEEGYPLIPDDVSFDEALTWQVAYRLSIRDELPNKKLDPMYCKQQWNFYCKQARAKGNRLSEDERARFARLHLGFSTDVKQYDKFYNNVTHTKRINDRIN